MEPVAVERVDGDRVRKESAERCVCFAQLLVSNKQSSSCHIQASVNSSYLAVSVDKSQLVLEYQHLGRNHMFFERALMGQCRYTVAEREICTRFHRAANP